MKTKSLLIFKIVILTFLITCLLKAQDSESKTKSVETKKGDKLIVKVDFGDLEFTTWDKNQVQVIYENDGDSDSTDPELTKDGNIITLKSGFAGKTDIKEINIPSYISLNALTDAGTINIKGDLFSAFTAKTAGGDINFKNVNGDVKIKTAGGNISGQNISGESDIKTAGGKIELDYINGGNVISNGGNIIIDKSGKSLEVAASGGNIEIGDVNGDLHVNSGGGNIIAGNISGSIDAKTGGGNISVKSSKNKVQTNSGGGNINLENINGSVDAKTGAGDINLSLVPTGDDESKITTGYGTITLSIPQDSKVTIIADVKNGGLGMKGTESDFLQSDFEETTINKIGPAEVKAVYQLNGGGTNINLVTGSGKIIIKKLTAK